MQNQHITSNPNSSPPSSLTESNNSGPPSSLAGRGLGGGVSWQSRPYLWKQLKPFARQMRTEPTLSEKQLWQRLKNKQLLGFKFRRQQVIDRFIVDFYCQEIKLVIEVDGEVHNYTQVEDAIRQEFLESLGLRVMRFKNEDVLFRIENVLGEIVRWLE
ncbi:endonuclease domain-containing protein [Nodularia sp. LEGE 06071]|nr:endonuclease domain-containing protein [Nodularia sp. LEGE 06071]